MEMGISANVSVDRSWLIQDEKSSQSLKLYESPRTKKKPWEKKREIPEMADIEYLSPSQVGALNIGEN